MDEWTETEHAVFDFIAEQVGLPYAARMREVWDESLSREENIRALQKADHEADAANLAFVRKLIEIARG